MVDAGGQRRATRRIALGTGIPQMPITTCHMPLGRADLGPGTGVGAEKSRREGFGWVLHHASGHPCRRPDTGCRGFELVFSRAGEWMVRLPSGVAGSHWWPGGRQSIKRGGGRGGASIRPPRTPHPGPPDVLQPLKSVPNVCFDQKCPFGYPKTVLATSMPCNIWLRCERHLLPQIMGSLLKLSDNLQRAPSVALKAKVFNRRQNTILLLFKM